jgi:hypothetical protein
LLPEDIALFNAMYRTSVKGRKDLVKLLFNSDNDYISSIDKSYTSRVSEIFNVYLKSLSIGLDFVDEDSILDAYDDNEIKPHELDDQTYLCTDYEFLVIKRKDEIRKEILSENPVMDSEELEKKVDEVYKERHYII